MKLRALLEEAWPYGAWLALVGLAYVATYWTDPYVFAFTVLGLGAASALVTLCGFVAWARAPRPRPRGVAVASALIAATSGAAFLVLSSIRWGC